MPIGIQSKTLMWNSVAMVISSWNREIGEGKMIGVIFLDLRRAFEVVDREILILYKG